AVDEFYAGMFALPLLCTGGWHAAADWGVLSLMDIVQFVPAEALPALGIDIGDNTGTCVVSCPVVVRWPFDSRARLGGEECWQLEPYAVVRAEPDDIVTAEQIAAIAKRFVR